MTKEKFKEFLREGALLQTGKDSYLVFIGPFTPIPSLPKDVSSAFNLLYRPKFWDFLNSEADSSGFYAFRYSYQLSRVQLFELLSDYKLNKPKISWGGVFEEDFSQQFEWSQKLFSCGKLEKTVSLIEQKGELDQAHMYVPYFLNHILENESYGWVYGYWDTNQGLLGFTPETLAVWNKSDHILKTMALAGTYAKSQNAEEQILKDKKVLNEHQIVIKDIKNKLFSYVEEKNVEFKPTSSLALQFVVHLLTQIECNNIDFISATKILTSLHPTSAMGIYPLEDRELVREFSQLPQQKNRDFFAAPFGVIGTSTIHVVVAIRNLIFSKNEVVVKSGCGLTKESEYNTELVELTNKRNSVKKAFGVYYDEQ